MLKKINQILKENEPFTDFISKIILAIITICIAISANSIAKKQTQIDEMDLLSNISIEASKNEYGMHEFKVYNSGGPVYDVETELYTLVRIFSPDLTGDICIPANIYKKSETGNELGLIAFYQELIHDNISDIENEINSSLYESNTNCRIFIAAVPYLKLSYKDALGHISTRYFLDQSRIDDKMRKEIESIYKGSDLIDIVNDTNYIYGIVQEKLK